MSDIVQELRNYLSNNPDFKAAFEAAFEKALALNVPQLAESAIFTLNQYIDFYDTLLKWVPSENMDGNNIYYQLCIFYFVIDLAPVKSYQAPIQPQSSSPWTWLSRWLVRYAQELGKFLDTNESINESSLATFYAAANYHMDDYPVPFGSWKTFNQFFARRINSAVRPVYRPDDTSVIDSPADSTFDGWWPIDDNAKVTTFSSKHIPWSIDQLLVDSKYGEKFKGGKFMHSFLAPYDYHRQHAPVAGKVVEVKVIPGVCYLQVVAESDANGKPTLSMKRELDAPDDPGYQFLQARGLIVLDTAIGLVAVLPMGMAQVSSVVLTVGNGDVLTKGQEISYFQFGGSDIVVVFEAASQVNITAVKGQHYNYGEKIAEAHVNSKPI